jgi:hypothetical protein
LALHSFATLDNTLTPPPSAPDNTLTAKDMQEVRWFLSEAAKNPSATSFHRYVHWDMTRYDWPLLAGAFGLP